MKNFPALFAAEKDKKTGSAPVWILKVRAGGIDYYLSSNAFDIVPWGVTTKRWIKSWGTITEGISGAIDEFKISDFSVSAWADPDDSPNILGLAETYDLEKDPCFLYFWFRGCTDPPQEIFRGYIRDYPISDGDTVVSLQIQDETLKWERTYIGKKITIQDYPSADPDDIGKIEPIIFNTVEKLPVPAVDAGVQTSLTNSVSAAAANIVVADIRGLSVGKVLQVDQEQMRVDGINGYTLTVIRGFNGTLAAVHQRGSVVWEQKGAFYYMVAGHPVDSIPKAYAVVGQIALDISTLCTVWPAGNHPNYPGKAVISVPGYITIEQAVDLAIADGIVVGSGNLGAVLTGNVTKTGSPSLSGSPALSGAPATAGSYTLSGLVSLLGQLLDPGHTHTTGQSNSENSTTGLPTPYTVTWDNASVSWGGHTHRVQGVYIDFPADGARSDASYSVTIKIDLSAPSVSDVEVFACINSSTVVYYYDMGVTSDLATFSFTFSTGTSATNRIYIGCAQNGYLNGVSVTAASRTIQLTGLVSSANSASVSKGSLSVSNGNLAVTGDLSVNNGTLAVTNGDLIILDSITVDKGTLLAELTGDIAKSGTVTLSGNSVANTVVGDKILVNVTRAVAGPGTAVQELLSTWCNVPNFLQVGAFPVSYAFNGAIREYRRALEVIHELAWQCRAYFRHSLGSAVLSVRELNPVSIKTLAVCRAEGGVKTDSRDKSPYQEIINSISLLYGRNWTQDKSEKAYTAVSKEVVQSSIDKYGKQERPDLFQCDFITSQAMADDVRAFYLAYYSVRHWVHTFDTFYFDSELEFMDTVTLGFSKGQVGQVSEVGFNPGSDTVQVKVIQ